MNTAQHMAGLENVRAFTTHRYIVWTQAGFNQAIRMLHTACEDTADDCPVMGYPESYPSFVVFSQGYQGYHYWQAVCTPLSRAIEFARVQLKFLEDADAGHRVAIAKTAS